MMSRIFGFLLFSVAIAGCGESITPAEDLAFNMFGTFQAEEVDSAFFRDSGVRLSPLGDGEWLYMQLTTGAERRLYRQQILHLRAATDGSGDVPIASGSQRTSRTFLKSVSGGHN